MNFLSFFSEIYIRKGSEGWHISTTFDNRSGDALYNHRIQIYKKSKGVNLQIDKVVWATIEEIPKETQITAGSSTNEIFLGSKNLNIKVPNGHWYEGKNYFVQVNRSDSSIQLDEEKFESFQAGKLWSGVWIQNNRSNSSWIFQDIEIFIDDKKYSQVFCQSINKGQNDCYQKHQEDDEIWIAEQDDKKQVQQMIQQISTSKGEWVDTEKFCRGSRLRNLNDDQLKNLELFCFSKQN